MNQETAIVPATDDLAIKAQSLVAVYDFLKHLSGLALVAVGGMLGLGQAAGLKPNIALFLPIALMSTVAFLSLMFMAMAAVTQIRGRVQHTSIGFATAMVTINVALFSAATSAFVTVFVLTMSR